MAIRVTQGIMYNSFLGNMNRTLGDLMESNIQSSSQKKVNRPSDDPFNAGRILNTRATLSTLSMYEENMNAAMGWLSTADSIIGSGSGSVQTALTRLSELASQGATGTYDGTNREQISSELRQLYEQLISLGNQSFNDRYIFGGQKTETPPYQAALAVDCYNPGTTGPDSIDTGSFYVDSEKNNPLNTVILQATETGRIDAGVTFRYSSDGGKTWKDTQAEEEPAASGKWVIKAPEAGVIVEVADPGKEVTAVDQENDIRTGNGTWLYVRPTAVYKGDENTNQVASSYGATVSADAEGNFAREISVRIDSVDPTSKEIIYSYSFDDGTNWVKTSTKGTTLPVPGGYLNLDITNPADYDNLTTGDTYQIQPHRADIKYQIGENADITVNMLGSDIFGGLYDYPQDGIDRPVAVEGPANANLFEVVGRLVAAAETNDQDGMGQAVNDLKEVMKVVQTRAAEVGGRENRLEVSHNALIIRTYSEEDNLSQMEDVDVTELMTRLAQQQVAYNSVLKSSSMIMQMSLVNFL